MEASLQWIGGLWCPARSGATFETVAPGTSGPSLGLWPRSGAEDLDAAVVAAAGAQGAWSALGRPGRLEALARALRALELEGARGALAQALGPALGADEDLAQSLVWEELLRVREALEIARDGGPEAEGTGTFALHWSERAGIALARVLGRLASGQCALLVADGRLPQAGVALARAFEEADLPTGALAVLVDDGRTLRRAARRDGRLAFARECASRHERLGLGERGPRDWTRVPLASGTAVVRAADDPDAAAEDVLDRALGPSRTLFGQFPGSVGRVLCERRVFSRFTAALLARLDADPRWGEVRAPVEEDLARDLQEAWSLGLDEGAAPIFGEPPPTAGARVGPLLFTNVDPYGRLIDLDRPLPLLRLARADSDDEARELALRLASRAQPA